MQTVAVRADGKSAATGDDSGRIRIWDFASGKIVQTITAHQAAITGLAFAADGTALFSCSLDKTLSAWNVADGTPAGKSIATSPLHGLALFNRGAWLVTGDADGVAHIWDTAALRGGAKGYQYAVAVAADGQTLLAAGSDGILRVWSGRDSRVKHSLAP